MWHARFSSRYALPCLILLCGFCASINHLQNVIQSVTELTQLICHDKEVVSTALIPNAINNFYTLQTAKGSVAHFRTLTTWGDWDEKCGNFMTASHYFSVLHSGAAGFCTRKSGFTILNTHTQVLYPLFRGFLPKPSTFRLESGNIDPWDLTPTFFSFEFSRPKWPKFLQ